MNVKNEKTEIRYQEKNEDSKVDKIKGADMKENNPKNEDIEKDGLEKGDIQNKDIEKEGLKKGDIQNEDPKKEELNKVDTQKEDYKKENTKNKDTHKRDIKRRSTKKRNKKVRSELTVLQRIFLLLLPVAVSLICIGFGRIHIPVSDIILSMKGHLYGTAELADTIEMTLWNIRFPRILLALLVGAGLSASGCAYQSLFSNPLATPDTLGVASGAGFGAALGILFGLEFMGIQLVSLLFGALAVYLTIMTGRTKERRGMSRVVLAGIMIGSLFNALIALVKFLADTESELPEITYWLMGTLDSASYDSLKLGAPFILGGILVLYMIRWRMNVLPLNDEEAMAMGVNLKALRIVTIFSATAITASCVSMCGQVGWIGLLVPHMCRMKFGNNHLALLPSSLFTGAAFMVVVDTIARSMSAAELPISILTAVIGAPFFIALMRKTDGWQS